MRVLVCGGRDYQDYDRVISALDALHKKHGITLVIEGGANGADAHGGIWADNNGIPRCTMRANWDKHGRLAGPVRNQDMIDLLRPDCVVAFPGGRGTSDMMARANSNGIKMWKVEP